MTWLREFLFRFLALFRRRKLEEEMAAEMREHLEMRTRRNVEGGMPAEEAMYSAQREFGGLEQAKERARDEHVWRICDEINQDLRYAIRQMRRAAVM